MLSNSPAIYQSVVTASQCAKLCTYYDSFHCESFDFCTDISTCFLGKVHYYDAPKANIKQMPSCVHYSRECLVELSVANSLWTLWTFVLLCGGGGRGVVVVR